MISRKYRIACMNGCEFFPQTRTHLLGVPITRWKMIAMHGGGSFGLYDTLEYPKDKFECAVIIDSYAYRKESMQYIEYEDYNPY